METSPRNFTREEVMQLPKGDGHMYLTSLSPKDLTKYVRDVEVDLILQRIAGKSYKDISAEMGWSRQDARTYMAHALRRMKRKWEENRVLLEGSESAPITSFSSLSWRVRNHLRQAGIFTLGDLTKFSRKELHTLPDISAVSVAGIEKLLAYYGLSLVKSPNDDGSLASRRKRMVYSELVPLMAWRYEQLKNDLGAQVTSQLLLDSLAVESIESKGVSVPQELGPTLRGFRKRNSEERLRLCKRFIGKT